MPRQRLIDERAFVPQTTDQARQLYHALTNAGTPVAQARGVVTWLLVLTDRREDDPSTDTLRRDYRRALLNLGAPPWGTRDKVGEISSAPDVTPLRRWVAHTAGLAARAAA
ncbi:MAG: hypothetical protein KGR26_11270 [Cyanobacteria bacterium REEB65]|nr:hypothetical protein [Cyanobacteria bacterium REEB65]